MSLNSKKTFVEDGIAKIDKNFKVNSSFEEDNVVWYDASKPPFDVYGMYYSTEDGDFRKFSKEVGEKVSLGFLVTADNTCGGRLRFKTNSPKIYLKVNQRIAEGKIPNMMTFINVYGLSLYSNQTFIRVAVPTFNEIDLENNNVDFKRDIDVAKFDKNEEHDCTIFFPLYGGVRKLYIGVEKGCYIEHGNKYKYDKPICFYGSSVTQGGSASRPGLDYVGRLSDMLDCDVYDFSASGSCHGEQSACDYLASLDPLFYVLDYDHNAPDYKHLEKTHYNLYKTIRKAHPTTPIVMISMFTPRDVVDSKERRQTIQQTYTKAKDSGDQNVYFIDGGKVFPKEFYEQCTNDNCHPNDIGFHFIALYLKPIFQEILNKIK